MTFTENDKNEDPIKHSTTRGATLEARVPNPIGILERIIKENPDAEEGAIKALMREHLEGLSMRELVMLREAMFGYWFTNHFKNLKRQQQPHGAKRTPASPKPVTPETEVVEKTVRKYQARMAEMVEVGKRIAYHTMLLPNGKLLRDCTAEDFGELAVRSGPWFAQLQVLTPPGGTGADITEDQIHTAYKNT